MKIRESDDILQYGEKIKIKKYDNNNEKLIINEKEEFEKNKIYSWEKEGLELIENLENKLSFSNKENYILMQLFKNDTIPKKYHPQIWLISSGAKRQIFNNKNYYYNLLNAYFSEIPSAFERQIDLDVPRTFSDLEKYKNKTLIQKLKNVLIAFSRRNITVGYCQGFNFIIGKFLEIYNENEEEVFWLFCQLIEVIFPSDYYLTLSGILTDTTIINDIIEMRYPNLEPSLKINYYNTIIILLTGLFINNVNEETLYTIYDSLFLNGSITIFKSVLFILDYCKSKYDSLNDTLDLSELKNFNQKIMNEIPYFHVNKLRNLLFDYHKVYEFSMNNLNRKRNEIRKLTEKEIQLNYKNKKFREEQNNNLLKMNSYINSVNNECDLDWPLCIYDKKYRFENVDYFVYKVLDEPNLIDNYYFDDCNNQKIIYENININFNDNKEKAKIYKNLLIERRNHLCINLGNNNHMLNKIFNDKINFNQLLMKKTLIENDFNEEMNEYESIDEVFASKVFGQIIKKQFKYDLIDFDDIIKEIVPENELTKSIYIDNK
jgi:hypothetical protein